MSSLISNLSTLERYVKSSIICSGFRDGINHPGGQPSFISMCVPNRIKRCQKLNTARWRVMILNSLITFKSLNKGLECSVM